MPKFGFSNTQRLQLLSRDAIEAIHLASMKLLEDVGVKVYNDTALKLLVEAGVDVDFNSKLAVFLSISQRNLWSRRHQLSDFIAEMENTIEFSRETGLPTIQDRLLCTFLTRRQMSRGAR